MMMILVAKSRFGFQFRSFWLPKCQPCIGLTEKVTRRRAVRRHSRQPSIQVTGVWWERRPGHAMVKAAEADAPVPAATPSTPTPTRSSTPAIRVAGDLRQTTPLPIPTRHATHVSDWWTSVNMNSPKNLLSVRPGLISDCIISPGLFLAGDVADLFYVKSNTLCCTESMFTKHVVNCDTIFGYILVPEIQPHRNDKDS